MPFRIGPPRSAVGSSASVAPPPPPPPPPVASFAILDLTPDSFFYPKTFRFTDTSTGVVTTRAWNPGDGTQIVSTAAVVEHTYAAAGTFPVLLMVSNAGGTAGQVVNLVVNAPTPAVAALSVTIVSSVAGVGVTVDVANASTGDVQSYVLDWGDGTVETPPANPNWIGMHTYAATPGTRTITLTAVGYDGAVSTTTQVVPIPAVPPAAAFALAVQSATPGVGATVQITNATTGDLDAANPYALDWGDGATEAPAAGWTTRTHVYDAEPGTRVITLSALGFDGSSSTAMQSFLLPDLTPVPAFALVTLSSTPGVGVSVRIDNTSSGGLDSYTHDWGDGATGVPAPGWTSATHTYGAAAGVYTITLTATNATGASASATASVTVPVFVPPTAAFTVQVLSATPGVGATVRLTNASLGTIDSYAVAFGDGQSASPALGWTTLDHTYGPTPGDFVITLTANGPPGTATSTVATAVVTVPAAGSYSGASVPLRALNGSAFAVDGEMVAVSVPFARGGPLNTAQMQVITSAGVPVPCHFRVLARWDALRGDTTAPIRMLQVVFPATIAAAATPPTEQPGEEIVASAADYLLATQWRDAAVVGNVVLSATASEYTIATGAATFVVKRNQFSPVDRASIGATTIFTNGRLISSDETGATTPTGVSTAIEQGALGANVRVVLKQTGTLGGLKFDLWLTFDHNRADFDVRMLLKNGQPNGYDSGDTSQLAGWSRHYGHSRMRDPYYRYVGKCYFAWDAAAAPSSAVTDAGATALTGSDDYRLMSQVALLKRLGGQGAAQSDYALRTVGGKTRTDTWHLATKVEGKNTTFVSAADTRYAGALGVQCGAAHVMLAMEHFWERGPHSFEAHAGGTVRIGMFPEDLPGQAAHPRCWSLRNDGYAWRMGALPGTHLPSGNNPRTGAAWTAFDVPPEDFPSATSPPAGSAPPADAYQRQVRVANVKGFVAAGTGINVAAINNGDYVVATAANVDGGNAIGDLLKIADKTAAGTARYNAGQRVTPRDGMYFRNTDTVDSGTHYAQIYFFQSALTAEADGTKWILHGPASADRLWLWQDRNLATNQPYPAAATQIQPVRACVNGAETVPQLAAVKKDDCYLAVAANLYGLTHAAYDILIPASDGTFAGATVLATPVGTTVVSFYDDAAFGAGVGVNGAGRKHLKLVRATGGGVTVTSAGMYDPAWVLRYVVNGALQTNVPMTPNAALFRANYALQGGRWVSCRARVRVGLGAVPTGAENSKFAAALRYPLLGMAESSRHRTTGALGGETWHERPSLVNGLPPDRDLQRHERWMKALAYDSASETGLQPITTLEFGLPAAQRLGGTKGNLVVNRAIGWDLFGEVLAGGVGMTTASYDPLRTMWLGLLYCNGDYQFFRNSRPTATFLKDFGYVRCDTLPTYAFNVQCYESGMQYADGSIAADRGHSWATGVTYEYLLLGDEIAYQTIDTLVRTGFMRGNNAPSQNTLPELRQAAWPLFSMADIYAALGPVVGDNGKTLLQEMRDGLTRFVNLDKGLINYQGVATYGPATWVPNSQLNQDDYPDGDTRFTSVPSTVTFGASQASAVPTAGRDYKNNGFIIFDRASAWGYSVRIWMFEIVLNAFLKISRVDPAFDINQQSGIYADWRALVLKMTALLKAVTMWHGDATHAPKTPYHWAPADRETAAYEVSAPAIAANYSVVEVFSDMSDALQSAGMFYAAWRFFSGSEWDEGTGPNSTYAYALESFRAGVRYNLSRGCRVATTWPNPVGGVGTISTTSLPIDRHLAEADPEQTAGWDTFASLGAPTNPAIYNQTTGEPNPSAGITPVSLMPIADIIGKVLSRNLTRESAPQLAALLVGAGAVDP